MRRRTWQWLRLVGLLAALALLVYIFRDTDPRQIWAALLHLDPVYLLPVLVGVISMPLVRAVRLKYIMEPKKDVPGGRMFAVYNVGQLLNIGLPALLGQAARVLLFSRTLGVTKTFAVASVILEVLFDGVVLLMMIFAASFLIVMPDWMVRGEVVIFVACLLILGFFYLVLHRHRHAVAGASRLRRWLPGRVVRGWENVRNSFLAGLDILTSRRHLLLTVLLSVLSWLAHALIVLFLLRAFSIAVPFWGAIIILIVNTIIIMVPLTPGNVGTFQLACILGLKFFGVPSDEALAFSIVLHLVEIGPVFVLGAIASFSEHVRLKEYTGAEVIEEQERLAAEAARRPGGPVIEDAEDEDLNPEPASQLRLSADRPEL